MNRKIMILMVAVVATVLPAVAVADVMISGSINGSAMVAKDAFTMQPGSNYAAANASGVIGWHAKKTSESEVLGTVYLGVMTNETTYEINVLDINFTASGYFNLTVSVPSLLSASGAFPLGSYIYFSNAPFSFSSSGSNGLTSTSTMHSVSLSSSATTLVDFGPVTPSTTIYVAFVVGAGPQSGSFSLAGTFTS
jgi:hypothetical protein